MRLVKTCDASPEQYDVFHGDAQVGYLRLRYGHFTARFPDTGGKLVYEADTIGDGIFDDSERELHLNAAVEAIKRELHLENVK
jgi:hypothetical protein